MSIAPIVHFSKPILGINAENPASILPTQEDAEDGVN